MVWLLPSHPSEAARCASTEDHQAPSPLRFREQEDNQTAIPIIFIVLSPYANIIVCVAKVFSPLLLA
jgi:hypothetical protein